MKKTVMVVMAIVMIVLSASFACATDELLIDEPVVADEKAVAEKATEEKTAAENGEKAEGWKPFAEISATAHNSYLEEYSGSRYFEKFTFIQSTTVGLDKNDAMGVYVQSENFFPFGKNEYEETDLYIAFYAKFYGIKIDAGYGRYLIWKNGEGDYNGIYAEITFPAPIWGIVPFVKGEYRFADKKGEDEDGNEFSQNGFLYVVGLKREFQLNERVNLTAKISFGGHDGIYGMPAENLSFAREKLEIKISLVEWMKAEAKFKASIMTQQNLGLRDGIAADTEKLFVSGGIAVEY